MPVAVVTDSTAYLPGDLASARNVTVVPLAVVIDGVECREGVDVAPADVARLLSGRRVDVKTSRPAPAEFVEAYRRLLAAGATGVVSVHLSQELSGTFDAAVLAAEEVGDRVAVVDSRATGMGLGFPTLAATSAAAAGGALAEVHGAAVATVSRTTTLFYVDTLEFLRRGGRIGAASALVGTALAVKPILWMVDGRIVLRDKVRTASRALARLVDLAVEAAGESEVDVAVHHLAMPDRGAQLMEAVTERLAASLRDRYVCELGPAVAAHVGPGFAGIVVHRRG
ncbi:MAG TPA: DegV family protein [Micromonosporaceae bacterium]|nr:DegV family protein [Micromonosporaceae bacterium]